MGKWRVLRNWIVDDDTEIAVIQSNLFEPRKIAEQIVREHNAHEALVELAREFRQVTNTDLNTAVGFCKHYNIDSPEHIGSGVAAKVFRKQIKRIDAALALAEGRE